MAASSGLDAFLTFGYGRAGGRQITINGETTDGYESEFGSCQLNSYTFNFSLDTTPGTETDNQSSDTAMHAPELANVQMAKSVDSASPDIFTAMTRATIFDDVWIWQKKTGAAKGKSGEYFWKIHLQQVHIARVTWAADPELTENIELAYQQIDVEYFKQTATGALDPKSATAQYPQPGDKKSVVKSRTANGANADDVVKQVIRKLVAAGYNKVRP